MNCPRCKTAIPPLADPDSIVTCPGCGSRLMTRSAAIRSQGGKAPQTTPPLPQPGSVPRVVRIAPASAPAARGTATLASALEVPPSATLPPTPVSELGLRSPDAPPLPEGAGKPDPAAKRKGAASRVEPAPEPARQLPAPPPAAPSSNGFLNETLELLVREVRSLRATQEHMLELLERGQAPAPPAVGRLPDGPDDSGLSPIRARKRKTVVLIDDDPATRAAALAELQQADVPVRGFDDGNAALSAIADDKPDVIVLELGLGGDMAGKDVINMIKATMEWVDVPIVLWTREPVQNQKEARQIHGADEIVPKSAGAGALARARDHRLPADLAPGAPSRARLGVAAPRADPARARRRVSRRRLAPGRVACGPARTAPRRSRGWRARRRRRSRAARALPVLAADTEVLLDGEVLGKPRDEDDAVAMLRRLAGRPHDVVTGVCLVAGGVARSAVERSVVRFAPMSEAELRWYAATGEPLDKAGGYHVDGRARCSSRPWKARRRTSPGCRCARCCPWRAPPASTSGCPGDDGPRAGRRCSLAARRHGR